MIDLFSWLLLGKLCFLATAISFDKEKEKQRIENLEFSLSKKITSVLNFYKWAVAKKNTSAVIIVDGRSGFGKTTLSNQMGTYCDINGYSLKKLHFVPETFLNGGKDKIGLANCQPGDVLVFDEAMFINNRSAMSIVNRMIIQAMSMMRSKRIIVIFNVNSIFDLDRNLALSRADILFHVYGDHLVDRGNVMTFFKGIDGKDRLKELYLRGKKYYDYSRPKSNFNCNFPMRFVLDEQTYEEDKQTSINNFLKTMGKPTVKLKSTEARDNYVKWLKLNQGMKPDEIAKIGNISRNTVYNILAKVNRPLEAENNLI